MANFLLPFYGDNSPSDIILYRPTEYDKSVVIECLALLKAHSLRSITKNLYLLFGGIMLLDSYKLNDYNYLLHSQSKIQQITDEEASDLFNAEYMSEEDNKYKMVALEIYSTVVRLHIRKRQSDDWFTSYDIPVEDFCGVTLL